MLSFTPISFLRIVLIIIIVCIIILYEYYVFNNH